jgi:hypothetical protein
MIPGYSQKADSLSPFVDSPSQDLQQANDRLQSVQDSLYLLKLQRNLKEHGKPLEQFLAERQKQERKEKQQLYIRIGLGAAFIVVLIIGIARQRKRRQRLP